ncbi:hypothetical protein DV515_00005592 [Chloebia gouldiae]|uniref:Thyroglobulin type-1 domain-containing protein n=1 Tax=Chloebia gouldiae TaxID=44316 RepID=A0A3L8SPH9_CHLGU|nr:hypothetical protein DV515_00005592 [Chloebia gouldiae]
MGRAGSPVLLQDLALELSTSLLGAGECMHVFLDNAAQSNPQVQTKLPQKVQSREVPCMLGSGKIDNGDDRSESILAENHVDGTMGILSGAGGRKPMKTGMKELAVMREKVNEQQRQMGKVSKAHHNHEDSKKSRLSTGRTPCQQELDQVLERISTMRLPDERGPLEHLYSLHIPNCDKHGLYNLKQCKMSVNGQRGECWCVDPIHGKVIQGAPTIRGDPECHLFYTAHEQEDRGAHALRSQ